MVRRVTKKAKCFIYKSKGLVIIFCPRINSCPYFCSTFKKYDRQGFNIICLNPRFYKLKDLNSVLREELERKQNKK